MPEKQREYFLVGINVSRCYNKKVEICRLDIMRKNRMIIAILQKWRHV